MSLQLFNDYNLDIKVRSIDSYVPIGGGGSIPDNSILNIKLVDKTIDNTKIADGTIISSLLDANLTVNNDLVVGNNLLVNSKVDIQNGNLSVAGSTTVENGLTLNNGNLDIINGDINAYNNIYTTQTIVCNILSSTTEISSPYLSTTQLHVVNGIDDYLTQGTDTLDGGECSIATTAISTSSFVLITRTSDPQDADTGFLGVIDVVSNTKFRVKSSSNADNGSFSWLIINPSN